MVKKVELKIPKIPFKIKNLKLRMAIIQRYFRTILKFPTFNKN